VPYCVKHIIFAKDNINEWTWHACWEQALPGNHRSGPHIAPPTPSPTPPNPLNHPSPPIYPHLGGCFVKKYNIFPDTGPGIDISGLVWTSLKVENFVVVMGEEGDLDSAIQCLKCFVYGEREVFVLE